PPPTTHPSPPPLHDALPILEGPSTVDEGEIEYPKPTPDEHRRERAERIREPRYGEAGETNPDPCTRCNCFVARNDMKEARSGAEATAVDEFTDGENTVLAVERFVLVGCNEKSGELDDAARASEEEANGRVASAIDH